MLSVKGVQLGAVAVAFVVFQMPPDAAPMYRMFASVGWAAIAVVRPLEVRFPGAVPLLIGAGPNGVHEIELSGIDVDGARRSSSLSNCNWADFRECARDKRAMRRRGISVSPR